MNLYKLFRLDEGSQSLPNVDKERYGERKGLEGPIRLRSGKVVYYDAKEGSYYDPDTDMYLDYDDYQSHDQKEFTHKLKDSKLFDAEGNVSNMTQKAERILSQIHQQYPQASSDMEALLLAYEKGQKQDRIDIERLGWENDQEEADIARHEKQLSKIPTNEAETDRDKAMAAAMANIEDQFKDMPKHKPRSAEQRVKDRKQREAQAMEKAKQQANMLMNLADKHGEKISAKEVGYFAKGIADGKRGYSDPKAGDAYGPNVYAYDAGVRVGEKLGVSESETPRVIGATPAQMADPKIQSVMKQAAARDSLERGNDGTYNPSTAGSVKSASKPGKPMFGVGILKKTSESFDDTPEHRELARLGRVLMDLGKDIDDRDTSEAMGRVGMELTMFGKPDGASGMRALERRSGQPQEVIYKMLAMAQKVQGDPAVGADVPDEDIDEDKSWSEINKELGDKYGDDVGMNWNPKAPSLSGAAYTTYKYLTQPRSGDKSGQMKRNEVNESDWEENFIKRLKAKISGSPEVQAYLDLKAKQYGDQNLDLDPGAAEKGLGIGVLDVAKARKKAKEKGVRAPGSLRSSPNTRNPERLPEAESQMVSATIPNNLRDSASKLERLAKENGVEYSRTGRTVTLTGDKTNVRRIFYKMAYDPANHPKMTPVNEAKDDIKIGDTVQTLKMGQMQGTVTGFSKKGGIDKVMFKHESGKVYATVPDNLRVISSKKTESLDDTVVEAKKKPVPTKPDKWAYAKAQAKKKFDVYPSAYANAWAAKKNKELGGGWRMGNPKKK